MLYGSPVWATEARWGCITKTLRLLDNKSRHLIGGLFCTTSNDKASLLIPLRRLEDVAKAWGLQYVLSRVVLPAHSKFVIPLILRSVRFLPLRHKNPIHLLPDRAFLLSLLSWEVEHLQLLPAPPWQGPSVTVVNLLLSKEEAVAKHPAQVANFDVCVYSDGPVHSGYAGAAAYIPQSDLSLTHHMGSASEITIFECELVGIKLGINLLLSLPDHIRSGQACIFVDNKGALVRLLNPHLHKPGQSLVKEILTLLAKNSLLLQVELAWCPGHKDIAGNKWADKLAKTAALVHDEDGRRISARRILPLSLSALRLQVKT